MIKYKFGDNTLFGYVQVYADQLKIIEQRHYRAIYCGLCKELGNSFGQVSRLGLSYDFAFLSLLEISLSDSKLEMENEGCIVNPFRKKPVLKNNKSLVFSANTAMLMVYYKLIDNIKDSGFFKKIGYSFIRPFAYFARKKAIKKLPQMDEIIKNMMKDQFNMEKSATKSLDEAALPSSKSLGYICTQLAKNKKDEKIFRYFGESLGRWVYLIDAADDYAEDIKDNSFNVFINIYGKDLTKEELKEKVFPSLNMARAEIINAYHLMEVKRYKNILDNILFLGLENMQHKIFFDENTEETTDQLSIS